MGAYDTYAGFWYLAQHQQTVRHFCAAKGKMQLSALCLHHNEHDVQTSREWTEPAVSNESPPRRLFLPLPDDVQKATFAVQPFVRQPHVYRRGVRPSRALGLCLAGP